MMNDDTRLPRKKRQRPDEDNSKTVNKAEEPSNEAPPTFDATEPNIWNLVDQLSVFLAHQHGIRFAPAAPGPELGSGNVNAVKASPAAASSSLSLPQAPGRTTESESESSSAVITRYAEFPALSNDAFTAFLGAYEKYNFDQGLKDPGFLKISYTEINDEQKRQRQQQQQQHNQELSPICIRGMRTTMEFVASTLPTFYEKYAQYQNLQLATRKGTRKVLHFDLTKPTGLKLRPVYDLHCNTTDMPSGIAITSIDETCNQVGHRTAAHFAFGVIHSVNGNPLQSIEDIARIKRSAVSSSSSSHTNSAARASLGVSLLSKSWRSDYVWPHHHRIIVLSELPSSRPAAVVAVATVPPSHESKDNNSTEYPAPKVNDGRQRKRASVKSDGGEHCDFDASLSYSNVQHNDDVSVSQHRWVTFDCSRPMGAFFVTESSEGCRPGCQIMSVDPWSEHANDLFLRWYATEAKLANGGGVTEILSTHHDLMNVFYRGRRSGVPLTVKFEFGPCPASAVAAYQRYQKSDWPQSGRWCGPSEKGWDGGCFDDDNYDAKPPPASPKTWVAPSSNGGGEAFVGTQQDRAVPRRSRRLLLDRQSVSEPSRTTRLTFDCSRPMGAYFSTDNHEGRRPGCKIMSIDPWSQYGKDLGLLWHVTEAQLVGDESTTTKLISNHDELEEIYRRGRETGDRLVVTFDEKSAALGSPKFMAHLVKRQKIDWSPPPPEEKADADDHETRPRAGRWRGRRPRGWAGGEGQIIPPPQERNNSARDAASAAAGVPPTAPTAAESPRRVSAPRWDETTTTRHCPTEPEHGYL